MTTIPDVVIVGAGSAGAVLAARLAATGREVVVLEAGPDYRAHELPDELRYLSQAVGWPHDWDDSVCSTRDRRLKYARGRVTGGSSTTNGGVAMRAEPPDFDAWPRGWQYDDILPYFCRLERDVDFGGEPWHGADGPIPIVRYPRDEWAPVQHAFHDACITLGFDACNDHNAPGTTGVGAIPMNRVGRERISTLLAYLEPARDLPNLRVRGGVHVRRLVIEHGAAVGVELVDGEIIRAGEVVLSSGVVQNPLLLWRSGIGPADDVRALGVEPIVDLPTVGARVTDHFVMSFATPIDPAAAPDGAPSIQTILRATAPGSDRLHDLQLTPWVRRHDDGRREIGISVSVQLPVGSGSITPASTDPAAPARIAWPFTAEPENIRRMREGWRLAAEISAASGITIDAASLDAQRALPDDELDELILETHTAFYHGVGTCAMGEPDDPHRVVDPECRLQGVGNVRVVDASVIPTVPRSNTNIVVIALAERMAELMSESSTAITSSV